MPLDIVMVSWFQQPIAATFALSLFAIDWSCQVSTLFMVFALHSWRLFEFMPRRNWISCRGGNPQKPGYNNCKLIMRNQLILFKPSRQRTVLLQLILLLCSQKHTM